MNILKLSLIISFVFTLTCAVYVAIPSVSEAATFSRLGSLSRGSNIFASDAFRFSVTTQEESESEDEPEQHISPVSAPSAFVNQSGTDNANGGASAANGGNGGNAGPGGLVRSGDVVTNATAVNMINTVIVRIGR